MTRIDLPRADDRAMTGAMTDSNIIPFPNPRNGEVYATEFTQSIYGQETAVKGFAVVHMSRSGDSVAIHRWFETLAEAKAAAVRIAREYGAVLRP